MMLGRTFAGDHKEQRSLGGNMSCHQGWRIKCWGDDDYQEETRAADGCHYVMGAPAMAVSLGGQTNQKVLWLVQCPDAEASQQWIRSVKAALLVQRWVV